jgi:hypothetical protein
MGPIVTYETKINGKHPLAKYGEFHGNRDGCFLIQSDAGVHARRDNSFARGDSIFRLRVSNQKDNE